ncbi:hypothetical protein [Methylibium sp.]|uniref:hypothetical protein n=1 Tax=Methylibium sp. TaxID=2067992 RepID=UPI0017CB3473|nr:hypothetical protein [Methylibium sp.]MBA3592086.1 hypothetical protein [Methylibium sp.]
MTVKQRIIAAVSACGPRGARQAEIAAASGIMLNHTSAELKRLCAAGQVFCIGSRKHSHYFPDASSAAAFAPVFEAEQTVLAQAIKDADLMRRRAAHRRKSAAKPGKPRKARAPNKVPKPAVNHWRQDNTKPSAQTIKAAVVVIPAGLKPTICPSGTDHRFTVTGPVIGGFATMGVGRYLEAA